MNTPFLTTVKLRRSIFIPVLSLAIVMGGCSDGAPKLKDASEETVYINTKGIEALVDEVEPGEAYKITAENILDEKESSRAIVHNLDNSVDTISMASLSNGSLSGSHAALKTTLMGGLAFAYFTGRVGRISPRSSAYKSTAAFNKSNGMTSSLKGAATARKVSVPGRASKGYGSGKSFRSFGG